MEVGEADEEFIYETLYINYSGWEKSKTLVLPGSLLFSILKKY